MSDAEMSDIPESAVEAFYAHIAPLLLNGWGAEQRELIHPIIRDGLSAVLPLLETKALPALLPMRVESHGHCDVGVAIRSQWRIGEHWHTVWPDGRSWCFPTVHEAIARAVEVRDIWASHPHLAPDAGTQI